MLAQRAYWRQQLADAPVLLELTLDYPRPPQPSGRGGTVSVELEPGLLAGVRTLAASCGATLFIALLAAWQVSCSKLLSLLFHKLQTRQVIGNEAACLSYFCQQVPAVASCRCLAC